MFRVLAKTTVELLVVTSRTPAVYVQLPTTVTREGKVRVPRALLMLTPGNLP